jgi:hypothetical protein
MRFPSLHQRPQRSGYPISRKTRSMLLIVPRNAVMKPLKGTTSSSEMSGNLESVQGQVGSGFFLFSRSSIHASSRNRDWANGKTSSRIQMQAM